MGLLRRRRLRQNGERVPGLLEHLDSFTWPDLAHAYGPAHEIPAIVLGLLDPSPDAREAALEDLFMSVWHQGTVYSSTAPTASALGLIAATELDVGRDRLIGLLAEIAQGYGEDEDVRAARAAVLDALGPLIAGLPEERDVEVRRALPFLLSVLPEAAEASTAVLRARVTADPDAAARASALMAIGALSDDALPAAGPEPVVRLAAAVAQARRARSAADALDAARAIGESLDGLDGLEDLELWTEGQPLGFVLGAPADFPAARLDLLTAVLAQPDADLRLTATLYATQLAEEWRSPAHDVADLLAGLLEDEDPEVAERAASGLRAICPACAHVSDALAAADGDPKPDALVALSRLRDARVLEHLERELRRDSPARWTGDALEAIGDVALPVRDLVIAHLQSLPEPGFDEHGADNRLVQFARWLGSLGPDAEPAVPALTRMLMEEGFGRRAAALSLADIGPAARSARSALEPLLRSDDEYLRAQAAAALYRIDGDPGPLRTHTATLLERPERGGLDFALDALPDLAGLEPAVRSLLVHADEWVRLPAARTIWRITDDWETTAPALREIVAPTPAGLEALAVLAEMPAEASAPLRSRLGEWLEADRRPIEYGVAGEIVERDERLQALCRRLLG